MWRPSLAFGLCAWVVGSLAFGCSDSSTTLGAGGTASGGSGPGGPGSGGAGGIGFTAGSGLGGNTACVGLECQIVDCPGAVTTTISGTVYEPAGVTPLYNVVVYVPNAPLDPINDGAACEQCGTVSGSPIVTTITDTEGRFVLENVPVGGDIPLVMQIGKWRRQITIPAISECVDNALTDPQQTRLPRNQSEGHIPRIALTTGGADPLECWLRKIGLDPAEFTPETGAGRVNLYAGNGGTDQYDASMNGGVALTSAQTLWATQASLMNYDIVLMACEAGQNISEKPQSARDAMFAYASEGGRIFASHWHNVWIEQGPAPFPQTATWNFLTDPPNPFTALIDQTFPKGAALAEWLVNVGGSQNLGELVMTGAQHTVDTVNTPPAQRWVYSENPDSVKYFTFNTPIGSPAEQQCGRVVYSDIHVSSGDAVGQPFPTGCTTTGLTPQEKALLFMLFDLTSCIQPDDDPPLPPPPS